MLVYILLLLGAWQAVLGIDEDICDHPGATVCANIPVEIMRFPKKEEQLDRLCPFFRQFIECLNSYAVRCGYENMQVMEFSEGRYPVLKDLIRDMCEKDARLHNSIVQNLDCFNEVLEIKRADCRENLDSKSDKMRKHLLAIEAENNADVNAYDPGLWIPFHCLVESLEVACIASKVSETCGSDAKDVVLEVTERAGAVQALCPASSQEGIAELIRVLELEMEEAAALNEVFRKE